MGGDFRGVQPAKAVGFLGAISALNPSTVHAETVPRARNPLRINDRRLAALADPFGLRVDERLELRAAIEMVIARGLGMLG
jgi:hypothetical protein